MTMEEFQEALIPDFIWKFVKKIASSPVKAGILALIISRYVMKSDKKENYMERLDSLQESWRSIGSNPKANKVSRWQNKNGDTLYITKKSWPDKTDYAVGLNAKIISQWFDDLKKANDYANNYMKKKSESYMERLDNLCEAWKIEDLRKIVKEHQAKKINGILIDVQSANVMVQVFDAMKNEDNKKKAQQMDIRIFAKLSFKAIK